MTCDKVVPRSKFEPMRPIDNGWTEWVKPPVAGYKMKCCDCGLVHEMEFKAFAETKQDGNGGYELVEMPWPIRAMFRVRRSEHRYMSEWQPIETAPKDGTSVLVAVSRADNIFIGAWRTAYSEAARNEVTGWWSNGAKNSFQPDQLLLMPTHWMPLPDLPS